MKKLLHATVCAAVLMFSVFKTAAADDSYPIGIWYNQTFWGSKGTPEHRKKHFELLEERVTLMKAWGVNWLGATYYNGHWYSDQRIEGGFNKMAECLDRAGINIAGGSSPGFPPPGYKGPKRGYLDDDQIKFEKELLEEVSKKYGANENFKMILVDEPAFLFWREQPHGLERYRKWLKANFARADLEEYGISDVEQIERIPDFEIGVRFESPNRRVKVGEETEGVTGPRERRANRFLWSSYAEFRCQAMEQMFTRYVAHWNTLEPGNEYNIAISPLNYAYSPLDASYSRLGKIASILNTDLYIGGIWGIERYEGLFYEIMQGVKPGRVHGIIDMTVRPTPQRMRWHSYEVAVHADGLWGFCDNIFRDDGQVFAGESRETTQAKRDVLAEVWPRIRKLEQYLVGSQTVSPISIVVSERSISNLHPGFEAAYESWGHIVGLYNMFLNNHVPVRALVMEDITPERIRPSRILVLANAECLTVREGEIIADWVKNGGVLISFGATSLFDRWGIKRNNYLLNDVLGVDYEGETREKKAIINWAENEIPMTGALTLYDHSQFKNHESIGHYIHTIDTVKLRDGAIAAARWDGSDAPAVVINRRGAGLSINFTARCPGFKSSAPEWNEFWGRLIDYGMKHAGEGLPITAQNLSSNVKVWLKEQKTGKTGLRYIVHLLDAYPDENAEGIKGAQIRVAIPVGEEVTEVRDGVSGVKLPGTMKDGAIGITVPDFNTYQCVVIELEKKARGSFARAALDNSGKDYIVAEETRAGAAEKERIFSLNSADLEKREKEIVVGIADNGHGMEDIRDALQNIKNLRVETVSKLDEETLDALDVFIIPAFTWRPVKGERSFPLGRDRWREYVAEWVRAGGGLLVTHTAAGYRTSGAAILPGVVEVGRNHPAINNVVITEAHPVVAGLEKDIIHQATDYMDHLSFKLGTGGYPLAHDYLLGKENPVIAIGAPGAGRYVACGVILGNNDRERPMGEFEKRILVNAVKWLAGAGE